jgi:hypothetical protein
MSRSNSLPYTAFGAWLLALLLVIFAYLTAELFPSPSEDAEREEQSCRSKYHQTADKPDQRKTATEQKQSVVDKEQNADPNKDAREYCIQRRAAKAGELQAQYALFGLVLVGATLVATFGAVIAAFSAASSARRTVETMNKTSERQLRAYVNVSGIRIKQIDNSLVRVVASFKNFGQTPAYEVRTSIRMTLDGPPPPSEFEVPSATEPFGTSSPQGELQLLDEISLADGQAADIQNGTLRLYVYGDINYVDTFGKERITWYCVRSDPRAWPGLVSLDYGNRST